MKYKYMDVTEEASAKEGVLASYKGFTMLERPMLGAMRILKAGVESVSKGVGSFCGYPSQAK